MPTGNELFALIVAVSFAAGLNVYATVATLGLLSRAGWLVLPGSLGLVDDWWVIGASGALFALEFVADKIPVFDLIWNALHTFVRVPVAAVLAYHAAAPLSPAQQMTATVMGGLIALVAHGGKTAARAAVTPSPEPVSNSLLSLGEDAVAIFLTWFAAEHPYLAAAIAVVGVILILMVIRLVWIALRALFRGAFTRRPAPAGHVT
jgi:hypothetical protein